MKWLLSYAFANENKSWFDCAWQSTMSLPTINENFSLSLGLLQQTTSAYLKVRVEHDGLLKER
jgi:hypothetical protein